MKNKISSGLSSLHPSHFKIKHPILSAFVVTVIFQLSAFFFYYIVLIVEDDSKGFVWGLFKLPFVLFGSFIIISLHNLLLILPSVYASFKLTFHPRFRDKYSDISRFISISLPFNILYTILWYKLMGDTLFFITSLDQDQINSDSSKVVVFGLIQFFSILLMSFFIWKWKDSLNV
jgi:hypothetical protein